MLDLAEALYQGCRERHIQERYFATQMFAEALLENNRPAEAAELFRQCLDNDRARQAEADSRTEKALKEKLAALQKARNRPKELQRLAEEYLKSFPDRETSPNAPPDAETALRRALATCKQGKERAGQDEAALADRLAESLESAYKAQRDRQMARVGLDAGNLFALARAYRSLGRFNESLNYYQLLLAGLGPGAEPALYWQGELEYCQCLLKGFAHQKDVMRKLGVRIRQLRIEDAEMGGLADAFLAVELQASRLAL